MMPALPGLPFHRSLQELVVIASSPFTIPVRHGECYSGSLRKLSTIEPYARPRPAAMTVHDALQSLSFMSRNNQNGAPDPEVFDLAQSLERVLLTHNAEDFHALHRERPGHQGIIAVYRDADPRKNMNHVQIAAAIRQLETLRLTIAGDFHVLNHWR
jgi:predicted nuclease of predicted toxin-antitoxin system